MATERDPIGLKKWFRDTLGADTTRTLKDVGDIFGAGKDAYIQASAGMPTVSDIIDPDYVRKRSKGVYSRQLREIDRGTSTAMAYAAASNLSTTGSVADVISEYEFGARSDASRVYEDALAKAKADEELVASQRRDRSAAQRRARGSALGAAAGFYLGGTAGASIGSAIGGKLGF